MFNSKFGIGVLKHPGYNMGGDPPAPAPTTSTSYSTNVPEYAQPYVENMLNAAQAQIYNPSMTGFNAYVPYSNNPADYVASASPMQQQAYSTAANMRVPGQYGMATRGTMGAMAGLGGVGNQMGNAGQNYMQMATNPYATQAFMNPYLQASLAPQLQLANQQYDIAGQQQQSKAAQQGAFGGSREALMGGLNRQNQMLAQNQIIGQGYNKAFDAAQQAQQFGSNLGLQGQQGQMQALQAMLGGSNQLAGIGGAQLAAQQGIANLQNQYGQQQQGQQQNIINQAVQNYATAQQYPFMQLGLLNSMLRGLPMQQSSTQMYQAPPNPLTQVAGLAATGYGLFGGSGGKKEGGVIKASGGIPISHYSNDQLKKVQTSPLASPLEKVIAQGELGLHNYITSNPEARKLFGQQTPQMPSPQQMAMMPQNRAGLDAIGTDDMVPTVSAAGGGLLAFVGGGDTSMDGESMPTPGPNSGMGIDPMKADAETLIRQELLSARPESDAAKTQREALEASIAKREKEMGTDKWVRLGASLLKQTSPFATVGAGNALSDTLDYISTQEDLTDKDRKELLKFAVEQDKNKLTRDDSLRNTLATTEATKEAAKMRMLTAQNYHLTQKTEKENKEGLLVQDQFNKMYKANLDAAIRDNANILKTNPASMDQLKYEAYNSAYQIMTKSELGKKHLGAIADPNDFKLTLSSMVPGASDNTVSPVPDTGSHWYDPSTWGSSNKKAAPAGQVDPNNKFLH